MPDTTDGLLENYRFQMGHDAGNLALAMDYLTDVVHLIGQHTTHCRVEKGLRAGEPTRDMLEISRTLALAKELVQESLLRLKAVGS